MADQELMVTQPFSAEETRLLPTWAEARRHLAEA